MHDVAKQAMFNSASKAADDCGGPPVSSPVLGTLTRATLAGEKQQARSDGMQF